MDLLKKWAQLNELSMGDKARLYIVLKKDSARSLYYSGACSKNSYWTLKRKPLIFTSFSPKMNHHKPLVSIRVVVTVTVISSMESSTGILYRLSAPLTLRFFLFDLFDPKLTTLSPCSTPFVKLLSCSSSHWSLRRMACPEVNSANSRKAGWRFLGSLPS